jgi:hypothetical protein
MRLDARSDSASRRGGPRKQAVSSARKRGRQIRATFWGESGTGKAPGKASALSLRADHAQHGVAGLDVAEPPAHQQHAALRQIADALRASVAAPGVLRLRHQD